MNFLETVFITICTLIVLHGRYTHQQQEVSGFTFFLGFWLKFLNHWQHYFAFNLENFTTSKCRLEFYLESIDWWNEAIEIISFSKTTYMYNVKSIILSVILWKANGTGINIEINIFFKCWKLLLQFKFNEYNFNRICIYSYKLTNGLCDMVKYMQ